MFYSNYAEGTPLSSAAGAGRYNVVAYLLSIGAYANGVSAEYNVRCNVITVCAKIMPLVAIQYILKRFCLMLL